MRYIFGICKFTVNAMLCHAKKLRLRYSLLCYCFHGSVSDCLVESRRSREKKGFFFLAAISKFRSWQKLEFLEKILEFLENFLEFFEILEFFWPWVFFKMSKKKAWLQTNKQISQHVRYKLELLWESKSKTHVCSFRRKCFKKPIFYQAPVCFIRPTFRD